MEILHFEYANTNEGLNVLFLIWGICLLVGGVGALIYQLIKDKLRADSWLLVVSTICGLALMILAIYSLEQPADKYVYARISQNVPYVSMVDNYEFVEREDDVYKLKVKRP